MNKHLSLNDWIAIISLVMSSFSLALVLFDKLRKSKLEKINFIITPRDKMANWKQQIFYIYFVFTNESSRPLSITDLNIIPDNGTIPDVAHDKPGGAVVVKSIDIIETTIPEIGYTFDNPLVVDHKMKSENIPIIIKPFESKGSYIAFYAGGSSSHTLAHSNFEIELLIQNKKFVFEFPFMASNYYDFSFKSDGTVFGKAVNSKLKSRKNR